MDLARSRSWRDFSRAVSLLFAMSPACHRRRHLAIPSITNWGQTVEVVFAVRKEGSVR